MIIREGEDEQKGGDNVALRQSSSFADEKRKMRVHTVQVNRGVVERAAWLMSHSFPFLILTLFSPTQNTREDIGEITQTSPD